jgi:hypothetical protein
MVVNDENYTHIKEVCGFGETESLPQMWLERGFWVLYTDLQFTVLPHAVFFDKFTVVGQYENINVVEPITQ